MAELFRALPGRLTHLSFATRWWIAAVLAAAATLAVPTTATAQAYSATTTADAAANLEQRIYESFDRQRYRTALELIDEYLQRWPNRPNMLYNKACAHALIGERNSAATALREAVEAGFTAFDHMRRDPDLASIHDHPTYHAILEAVQQSQRSDAHRLISRWRNRFDGEQYKYEVDESHRLCYATALDDVAHGEMREMLENQADHLAATFFDSMPDYYAMVAVPTPDDADVLLKGDASVGGLYDHNQRVLVTRNIGGSLRHEFFHLMHYGHMNRIGQKHPLWIQEGMASLYEDYELRDDGSIRYLPNERHNVVRRLARGGVLMSWDDLFTVDDERFMQRASRLYPQVRSMFEFIAARGQLTEWYRRYVQLYDEDSTGQRALEDIFDAPINDIERQWRRWVLDRPAVDLYISDGDAALGIIARPNATNDGVMIAEIVNGSSAQRSGLKVGDVIVSVNDVPTRSLKELQGAIGKRSPGDIVKVRARRGEEYFSEQLTLQALRMRSRRMR